MGCASSCRSLQVIYLQDNQLPRIPNMGGCSLLTELHLQNNALDRLDILHLLPSLQKLFVHLIFEAVALLFLCLLSFFDALPNVIPIAYCSYLSGNQIIALEGMEKLTQLKV